MWANPSVRSELDVGLRSTFTSTRIKAFVSLLLNVCQAVSGSKCARFILLETFIRNTDVFPHAAQM